MNQKNWKRLLKRGLAIGLAMGNHVQRVEPDSRGCICYG